MIYKMHQMDNFQTLQCNCLTVILTWLTMVSPSLTKMERHCRLQPSAQFVTKRCGITSQMTAVFMIEIVPVVLPRFILIVPSKKGGQLLCTLVWD